MIKTIRKKIEAHATDQFVVPSYLNGFKHTEVYVNEEGMDDLANDD